MNGERLQGGDCRRRRRGTTLVEYAVILVIVSIVGVILLKAIGSSTNKLLESTNSNMPA